MSIYANACRAQGTLTRNKGMRLQTILILAACVFHCGWTEDQMAGGLAETLGETNTDTAPAPCVAPSATKKACGADDTSRGVSHWGVATGTGVNTCTSCTAGSRNTKGSGTITIEYAVHHQSHEDGRGGCFWVGFEKRLFDQRTPSLDYVVAAYKAHACSVGEHITSESVCKENTHDQGYTWSAAGSWHTDPPGCFVRTSDKKAWFNQASSTASCSGCQYKPFCKLPGTLGTKCVLHSEKFNWGKLDYYIPGRIDKNCKSRRLVSIPKGQFIATCALAKSVSCRKIKCQDVSKCTTYKFVRCVQKCNAVDDTSEKAVWAPDISTFMQMSAEYRVIKWKDWPHGNTDCHHNRHSGGRCLQKMKADPATCTTGCDDDAEDMCATVAQGE